MTWKSALFGVFLKFFLFSFNSISSSSLSIHIRNKLPDDARLIWWTSCEKFAVKAKLALEDVVIFVGNQLLHWLIILSIFWFPDEARPIAGASHDSPCVFGNGYCTDRDFVLFRIKFSCAVFSEVPNANSSTLVPEDDLSLVRMKYCRINHHPVIVKITHESHCFEVKHLQGTVFARCKEPLVVFLKLESRDISCMSLEKAFLIDDLAGARLWNLVYLHYVMSCNS